MNCLFPALSVAFPLQISLVSSLEFLHITDIHYDTLYRTGASIDSLCRELPAQVQGQATLTAGEFGSPQTACDSPLKLVDGTFAYLKHIQVNFVIWTGDNSRHDSSRWPKSWEQTMEENRVVSGYFSRTFARGIPVIPSIGNNDLAVHNQLEFTSQNYQLEFFADLWSSFIPKDQDSTFRTLGCFTSRVSKSLSVISLNTMYLFLSNNAVGDCNAKGHLNEAGDHVLDWLKSQLKWHQKRGISVYISGHVPPSVVNYKPICYQQFAKLSLTYRDTVKGQFYGHMNMDHFFFPIPDQKLSKQVIDESGVQVVPHEMVKSAPQWTSAYFNNLLKHYGRVQKKKHLPMPVFVSPSIIPVFNPSFRVFVTDSDGTGTLRGYKQYYMDLSSNKHDYNIEYTISKAYNLHSSDTNAWRKFAHKLSLRAYSKLTKEYFSNMLVRSGSAFSLLVNATLHEA